MNTETALLYLCWAGIVLAAYSKNWTERQRLTTIFVLLLMAIIVLLARY